MYVPGITIHDRLSDVRGCSFVLLTEVPCSKVSVLSSFNSNTHGGLLYVNSLIAALCAFLVPDIFTCTFDTRYQCDTIVQQ